MRSCLYFAIDKMEKGQGKYVEIEFIGFSRRVDIKATRASTVDDFLVIQRCVVDDAGLWWKATTATSKLYRDLLKGINVTTKRTRVSWVYVAKVTCASSDARFYKALEQELQ